MVTTSTMFSTMEWDTPNSTNSIILVSTDLSSSEHIFGIVTFLLNAIALVSNFAGNLIIIVAVSRYHWLGKPLFSMIQMLAVADLSVCLYNANSVMKVLPLYPHNIYIFVRNILAFTVFSAVVHVGLSAMERFAAITFPIKYQTHASAQVVRRCSAFVWMLAIIVCIYRLYLGLNTLQLINLPTMSINGRSVAVITIYLIYTVTISVVYWNIYRIASRRGIMLRGKTPSATNGKQQRVHRATQMIILVVGVFLIRWAPFVIVSFIALFQNEIEREMENILEFTIVIGHFNSSANILFYYNYNEKMKAAIRKMLRLGAINTDITRRYQ